MDRNNAPPGFVGLENSSGVECYCNAVIQLLVHLWLLSVRLMNVASLNVWYAPLTLALLDVFQRILTGGPVASARLVRRVLGVVALREYGEIVQNDTAFFLIHLLERLAEEQRAVDIANLWLIQLQHLRTFSQCWHSAVGQVEAQHVLALPIPPRVVSNDGRTSPVSLMYCLAKFMDVENLGLDNQLRCSVCAQLRGENEDAGPPRVVEQRYQLLAAPSIFLVQLKRVTYDSDEEEYVKNDAPIVLEHEIDISRFCSRGVARDADGVSVVYELKAFIVHKGVPKAGHYWTFVKIPAWLRGNAAQAAYPYGGAQWFVFNDLVAEAYPATESDFEYAFNGGGAVVAAYERREGDDVTELPKVMNPVRAEKIHDLALRQYKKAQDDAALAAAAAALVAAASTEATQAAATPEAAPASAPKAASTPAAAAPTAAASAGTARASCAAYGADVDEEPICGLRPGLQQAIELDLDEAVDNGWLAGASWNVKKTGRRTDDSDDSDDAME